MTVASCVPTCDPRLPRSAPRYGRPLSGGQWALLMTEWPLAGLAAVTDDGAGLSRAVSDDSSGGGHQVGAARGVRVD